MEHLAIDLGGRESQICVRSSDGQIGKRLARYENLGAGLGIRAQPAAIVSGPNGTRTLQDSPSLSQITAAIDAVG